MVIPRKEDLRGIAGVPKGSTKETKRAVVFATLGLPLDPVTGILVIRSEGQKRMDGEAYFTFNAPLENFERVNLIYSAGRADIELDSMLERLKTEPAHASIAVELEKMISDALIVYGRRFLENYQRVVQCLMNKSDIEIKDKDRKSGAFEFTFYLEKRR